MKVSMSTSGGIEKHLMSMLNRAKKAQGYIARVVYPQYQNAQMRRWASENATEGQSWKQLNAKYAEWKLRKYASAPGGGSKMMIATGRLQGATIGKGVGAEDHKAVFTDTSLTINVNVPYAKWANEKRNFTKFGKATKTEILRGFKNYVWKDLIK